MDIDQAREFLRGNHRAVMVTRHADGRLQTSPITVGVDGDGFAVVSTRQTAAKTRNVTRDPRVTLCVMNDGFYGEWIQIDGEVEVIHLPEAMQRLVDYYRSIAGEHPDWEDYRAAMVRDKRVILRITLTGAGPDRHG